jgi:DNA-binding MarR family transcriptional regulator
VTATPVGRTRPVAARDRAASVGLGPIEGGHAASPERRAIEAMMAVQRDDEYEPSVAHLPWELKRAERAAARLLDAKLRGTGLTKSQFGVIQALAHMRKASSAELARTVFVTPQAMVGLITTLERKGYIERSQSEVSARIIDARLTAAGRAAWRRASARLAEIDDLLTDEFSQAEVVRLSRFLTRLSETLNVDE